MSKINNSEFMYPWIEYLHFAAWYRNPLPSPLSAAGSVVDVIERILGPEEIRENRTVCSIMVPKEMSVPTETWDCREVYNSLETTRVPVREFISRSDVLDVGHDISRLLIAREAGVFPKLRIFDQRWILRYSVEQEYPAEQNDTTLLVSFRTDLLRQERTEVKAEELCDGMVEALLAAGDTYHMIVTCNHFRQDAAGARYQCGADICTVFSCLPHQLEDELWTRAGRARRDKVRGIHWGNYLCPDHVRRLRDPEGLIKEFTRLVTNRPGNSRYIKHYPDGGMFIKLSQSPMAQSRWGPDAALGDLAALLHRHFRAADLLF